MAFSGTSSGRAFARTIGLACAGMLALGPSLGHARTTPTSAGASSADEGSEAEAETLSDQAVEAFGNRDYETSIELFEQAYALNSNPNYLFNIGRVYEEKGDLRQAVAHYQRFVAQPGVDLESREAATARLKVLREALAQLEDEEPEPEEPTGTATPPGPDEPVDTGPRQTPRDRKRGQRIAGYVLLGAGGASLIVGGILGGVATSTASDADDAEFVDDTLRMRDDARRQARAADAMFITGGVLAAGGLVLVLTTLGTKKKENGAASSRTTRRWVLSPTASPTSGGAMVRGRF